MTPFEDLMVRAVLAERDRDARAIARAAQAAGGPKGLRATLAARLAHAAFHVHPEAVRFWVAREICSPSSNGSH